MRLEIQWHRLCSNRKRETGTLTMKPTTDSRPKEAATRLMIVEDDSGVGYAVTRWLNDQQVRTVLATTTDEATQMLRDVVFIESRFDGLLVDYNLPDATGVRVIQQFRDEFPNMPVAVMTGSVDIALELWLKKQSIPLFRKPLQLDALQTWVDSIRKSA
jgi:DNA-binding NtrC family response regulator